MGKVDFLKLLYASELFKSEDGRTVWAIDQLSQSMKEGNSYTPEQIKEYDCWTLLLPEEY
jgi:hypothetical protein